MLDFFLAGKLDSMPETPDDFLFLGGLNLEEHAAIEKILTLVEKRCDTKISFFDDLLICYQKVALTNDLLQSSPKVNLILSESTEFQRAATVKLGDFFQRAANLDSGLLLFCD